MAESSTRSYGPVWLVFAAGVAFTLYLQSLIPGEVFLSGDGGVKSLMTRQLSRGVFHADLRFEAPNWVRQLWADGHFPIQPTEAFQVGQKHYSAFPWTLPALTAPFYRVFGFRGYYLIPLASTWVLWLAFVRAGRRLRLRAGPVALGLGALVFGTPVTYYSAAFLDHTAALALAFAGLAGFLFGPFLRPARGIRAFVAGLTLGSSVCFREEYALFILCCAAVLTLGAACGDPDLRSMLAGAVPLALGALVFPALFAASNLWLFDHVLGIHRLAGRPFSWRDWGPGVVILERQIASLAEHGWTLLALVVVPILLTGRRRRLALWSLTACALFFVALPLVVRNDPGLEWGPRFMLILFPLGLLFVACATQTALRLSDWRRSAVLFVVAGPLVPAAYLDTLKAARFVATTYDKRIVDLRAMPADRPAVVATSSHHVAQLMPSVADSVPFVLTRQAELEDFTRIALANGVHRFLYIHDPARPWYPFRKARVTLRLDRGIQARFERRESAGRYGFYDARIVRRDP